ncbi:CDC42 binding protein kinase [Blyttiomyces sp. JEL0837]|nr:CDC42 binding protein kinase [Blyttiomyces sp. JEL0837]
MSTATSNSTIAGFDFNAPFRQRFEQISNHMSMESDVANISLETLLDTLFALFTDCKAASNQTEHVSGFVNRYEKIITRLQSLRVNTQDFEVIKILATGAVGKVCLVTGKIDKQVYAMKILKKTDLLTRREAAFFMEERNALVFAQKSEWITTLYAAFQDEEYLYLVMEYASGGSLRALINSRETAMSESEARFYVAEMLVCLSELHQLKYIHRDVKPENCLIGSDGHLKLADFGSCIRIGEANKVSSHETVGTPGLQIYEFSHAFKLRKIRFSADYISPEILRAHEGNVNYGKEVDFWSLGIIMYELLFDEVPFYSESLMETYGKIMDHEKHFAFPDDIEVSGDALDLIKRGPLDTRYFEDEENESKKVARKNLPRTKEFSGQNLPFVGYTYVQNANAVVSWPFSTNLSRPLSKTLSINGSGEFATIRKLEIDLQSELQKRESLDQTVKDLKASQQRDAKLNDELQAAIAKLEKDTARLDAEAKQYRSALDKDASEREELQSRLNVLKRRLDSDSHLRSQMESLEQDRDQLRSEVENLRVLYDKERDLVEAKDVSLGDLTRAKASLEKELQRINAQLVEEKKINAENAAKATEAVRKLDREVRKANDAEAEIALAASKCENLAADVVALRKSLSAESSKSDRLTLMNNELERAKALLDVDLKSARRQLEELADEKKRLEKMTVSSGAVDDLRSQISSLKELRAKDTDALSAMTKERAVLELELADLKEKYRTDIAMNRENEESLKLYEAKIREQNDKIAKLEDEYSRLAVTKRQQEAELSTAMDELQSKISTIAILQDRISQLESDNARLTTEVEDLRCRLAREQSTSQKAQAKISEFEKSLSEEKRARGSMEAENAGMKLNVVELTRELTKTKDLISGMKVESAKQIGEHELAVARLKAENGDLLSRGELEARLRESLNEENARLAKNLREIQDRYTRDNERLQELEKNFVDAQAQILELESHRSLEAARSSSLQDKIDELEQLQISLQNQVEEYKGRLLSRSVDSLAAKPGDSKSIISSDSKSERTKLKLKNVFFRSQQQRAEQEKAMQKITEAEEDIRRTPEMTHLRNISATSIKEKTLTALLLSAIDFEFSGDLRGYVKIPKGGKVKKGWKSCYAIIREYKLYTYEREKDVDAKDVPFVVDLRAELFVVKGVAQNELIHASSKDIDCIFKIQFSTDSNGSNNISIATPEIPRKIVKLQAEIHHEEKMQQAAEKLLSVSLESQKPLVFNQIEVSNRKISKMKLELNQLMEHLNSKGHSASSIDSTGAGGTGPGTPNLEEISQELMEEEIQLAKKELHYQLDDETRKLQNLKSYQSDGSKNVGNKEVENEIQMSQNNKHRIEEELATLDSDDKTRISLLVRRIIDRNSNGHNFKSRQIYKPMECAHCREALWGHRSYECTNCKIFCHSSCRQLIDLTCAEMNSLKKATLMYFMAESPSDKARWIHGLEYLRREVLKAISPSPLMASLGQKQGSGGPSTFSSASSLSQAATNSPKSHSPLTWQTDSNEENTTATTPQKTDKAAKRRSAGFLR